MSNNHKSHTAEILIGVAVTVIGGLILAFLVGEGRFAPLTDTPVTREPITSTLDSHPSSPIDRTNEPVPTMTLYWTPTSSETNTPMPTATIRPTPTTDLIELHGASLRSAIRLLGDIEAQAQYDLDPTPLSNVFIREALKYELSAIDTLRKYGVYAVEQRHDIQFENFSISNDGTRAEVYVVPTWEVTYYLIGTNQCVSYIPPAEYPQTIFLENGSTGWLAYAIEFDEQIPPELQPCQ